MKIYLPLLDNIHTDWNKIIEDIIQQLSLKPAIEQLKGDKDLIPQYEQIFNCFNYFNIDQTKVVIVGQDPYPNCHDACGVAFAINHQKPPRSLINIKKELMNDLGVTLNDYSLQKWAKQGVLLLNRYLTNIHQEIWQDFVPAIIQYLDTHHAIVFILIGKGASELASHIKNNQNNSLIIGHPSFAHLHGKFFGSHPFSRANFLLEKIKKTKICW